MELMQVRPPRPDSYERQFHNAGVVRGLLEFHRTRAFGTVYSSRGLSSSSAYLSAEHRTAKPLCSRLRCPSGSMRLWIDETHAVSPLSLEHRRADIPGTIRSDCDSSVTSQQMLSK